MSVDIRSIDPTSDRGLRAAYDVESASLAYDRFEWVPLGFDSRAVVWRRRNGWTHDLWGAYDGTDLVGIVDVATCLDDTLDTAWLFPHVLPGRRRQRIGTRLVRQAELSLEPSRTRLVGTAHYPEGQCDIAPPVRFAESLGYRLATTETVRELDLTRYQRSAGEVRGYGIQTFVNGVPHDLRVDVGRIKGLVDADAPSGELDWGAITVTPEQYAAELKIWRRQERTVVESVALTEDRHVVAWTCVVASSNAARPASVEGTLVLTDHRGHGLGQAVKDASLIELKRASPNLQRVRTSSDDENQWMHRINERMGFAAIEVEGLVQRSVSDSIR
jgi:GNAT superfamily N-acetyltransferase